MKENTSQPIRVLEVFGKMNRGGAETMMMNLYRKMDRSRVQLDFMVHTEEHCQFDDEIEQLGGHIYRVPRFKVYNILSYIKAWRRFFKAHPEIRVVHGHIGSTAAIYLHEANRARCYTIAHSHSAFKMKKKPYHLAYYLFSHPTRFVAKQFFGCSTEAGQMRFGERIIRGKHYQNFPNAIDLSVFRYDSSIRERVRYDLGILPDQLVIIHVGRIVSAKNPAMIFRVFSEIVKQNSNAVCMWVGFGDFEEQYRNLIAEEGLQDRIKMTGVREDIPQLLQAADAFLFPSLWEGLPVSVIEAQATGLPCVVADTVPKEVEITPLVEWHSLEESPKQWAETCIHLALESQTHRFAPTEAIRAAGYDIEMSVKELSNIYTREGKSRL